MSRRRETRPAPGRTAPGASALLSALALACGPYPDIAQKLDVTTPIAGGDTFIAAAGAEVRVLVLGKLTGRGPAAFAFASMQMPISAGTSALALQGSWNEDARAGTATFHLERQYTLPDERSVALLSRKGSWRADVNRTLTLAETRSGDELALAGDPALAAVYVGLAQALARLDLAAPSAPTCAFQIANLAIRSSEIRIIGFGGPGMTQYDTPATYAGTLAGSVLVSVQGFFENTTTITYSGFQDFGGVQIDGAQITLADASGDGHMSGTLRFAFFPEGADGSAPAPVAGGIGYDSVEITGGNASGGEYAVSLDGGGSATVSPVTAPSPTAAECLGLP